MAGMVRAWLIWFVLLYPLYVLLADNTTLPELLTGVVAAAIGATGAVVVRAQRTRLLKPRPRMLKGAWRPLLGVFADLLLLAQVLVARGLLRRPSESRLDETPFTALSGSGEDAAERALAEALGSLAPNSIVVGLDHERGVLVTHRLRP
jgi:multisubunit Na+/H+ antiporter MnhE subunit